MSDENKYEDLIRSQAKQAEEAQRESIRRELILTLVVPAQKPQVGLWWFIEGKIYKLAQNTLEAPVYDGYRMIDDEHVKAWKSVQENLKDKIPDITKLRYNDPERGRVWFHIEDNRFSITCSKEIKAKPEVLRLVKEAFCLNHQCRITYVNDHQYDVRPAPVRQPTENKPQKANMLDAEQQERELLFKSIKAALPVLEKLLKEQEANFADDMFYRLYHQSFKVYGIQKATLEIVSALKAIMPRRALNTWFRQIIIEGTGKTFEMSHNERWLSHTRPLFESYCHAKKFLELMVRCKELTELPPYPIPSWWAAILYLYDLR